MACSRRTQKPRRKIVPSPPEQATAPACDHAPARLSWARLLKRVFDIVDIEHWPNCGGSLGKRLVTLINLFPNMNPREKRVTNSQHVFYVESR